ncbi:MAG: hypothetical protein A3J09_01335 [Candidatus Zambryskibacteria bacterium RIFCSPLOWO2_02_FULL_51_21]|uniref:Baseplate protein J-like domain-containing protein n=1 Tax=Candidatus Zambryskibacteria bacterium RIFCSPHIGHO2_02_FULL_43_37 TaxID=1802749 RepID=A0A1G2TH58_9BACT|nr:MAG: hypothetical protein A2723_01335 [Candidatus Zambryskibacteria bacterium RIFCSPHIGHO2_01_FULL_52_18]OHA96543.1 MAG: hypothetical protein A3D49_01565 [Candidatus Zambryskibacteria bacterium RIFCSPHIGHO2_02_FULL_43_37]OHB11193.1 MAG: hypothetical protein A3J09_01335 [Candidatus Zambryskibacteria bacterium RIFCSPLOWO2_02_FULL_51_21]
MPKKIEDIVIPDRKRSIRDIPVPESRRKEARTKIQDTKRPEEESEPGLPPVRTPIPRHRRGSRKRIFWASIVAFLILVFAALSFFNGATLSYTPKSAALAFKEDVYTAHKSGTNGLFYSVVKLSRDKGMAAAAGGEQDVSRKASGVIIVYNDSAEAQRLVVNTRFESSAGKIYRIDKPITVPAKKTVSGSAQPGSVEATVYADQAGEAYNSAPTDFTVPGLKGTPRFESVYARSKTPIAAGFIGKEKVVKSEDLVVAKSSLQASLKEELYTEAEAEVPEDFVLFRSLSTFDFEDLPQTAGSGASVVLNMRGHFYGVMFKRSDLASFLAVKKLGIGPAEPVGITDYSPLNISFASAVPEDLLSSSDISFKITGAAQVVWLTDEVALKADLAGHNKSEVQGILNNYPTIAAANITVRPFWKSSLPDKPDKIKVVKLPAQ